MTVEQVAVDSAGLRKATRKGLVAAGILAVLTLIEFFVWLAFEDPLIPLIPFVFAKGWIILDSFMHVRALWSDDH